MRLYLIGFFIFTSTLINVTGQSVSSPDGNLQFAVSICASEGGNFLSYTLSYKNTPVILESALGLEAWENGPGWKISSIKVFGQKTKDTLWHPLYGERNTIRDFFNELTLCLTDSDQVLRPVHIIIRAYNEGIAFRYYLPEGENGGEYLHITSEKTEFVMPEDTKAWYTPVAQAKYSLLPLYEWPGECERPLTMELPGGLFVSLTEAEMVNYSRTKFVLCENKKNTIKCSMYGAVDEIAPFHTPWRVIMVAEKPGDLLQNNDLILNLNPPSAIKHTWWIRPGKIMREMSLSTTGALQLVDFAVQHNLQYIHFDAGWYGNEYLSGNKATGVSSDLDNRPRGGLDLKKVIEYATKNNIGIFLYVNQRSLAKHLDELLPLYHEWGVSGLKFGFVQVGSHRWTTWLHEAVKKCADYQLMVDIHDEYRPTGFSRTYPNLLTQEGIYGNEGMPDATHNVILPFTRFIAGPGDYTICYYTKKIKTTHAHQLALSVVCYSPLQFLYWYNKPKNYNGEPEIDFFDKVPTVWDDTRVLQGEIGQYVSIARRSGNTWYLGVLTGNSGREVKQSLDFLDNDKVYVAHVFSDGGGEISTATHVKLTSYLVDKSTTLKISLKDNGGEAVYFSPASDNDLKKLKRYNR